MRHWNSCRGLLSFTVLLVLVVSLALVGCNNTGGNTATVNGIGARLLAYEVMRPPLRDNTTSSGRCRTLWSPPIPDRWVAQ